MAKCVVIRELPSQNAVDYRHAVKSADIENGHVVSLGEMIDHDLWTAVAPDAVENLWLVTGVELMYDERKNITDYVNESGKPFRVERVLAGGIFAISTEGLTIANPETDLVKGASVIYTAGAEKLTVAAAASGTVVGEVIDVYSKGGLKFAAIAFAKAVKNA